MSARFCLPALVASALCLSATAAHAQPLERAEPVRAQQPHVQASLGVRVSKVADAGFDPFAESDELVQVSLGLGAMLVRRERWSLAAVGFWDYGEKSATARGSATSLDVHRLTVGPELRYQLLAPLYLFVHVLPAFAHTRASLEDNVAGATRYARDWSYGLEGAAGAAFEVYGVRNGAVFRPRLWAIAEGGYGYLGSTRLLLSPDAGQAPQRTSPVDLGSVSLTGPYLRVSAALSF